MTVQAVAVPPLYFTRRPALASLHSYVKDNRDMGRIDSPPPVNPAEVATVELLRRAREGDDRARSELARRYFPLLRRWASGRLPGWARSVVDTDDIVQDTLFRTLGRVEHFEPRGEGAFHAYLREALRRRIIDEVRRAHRGTATAQGQADAVDPAPSPLETAVGREALERYEAALLRLRPGEREAILARVELGLPYARVAETLGKSSSDAARMAVSRALVRLAEEMAHAH